MENATVEVPGLPVAQPKCSFCLVVGVKLFTCSRCKCTRYCSKECQKKHWILHKKICSDCGNDLNTIDAYKLKSTNYAAEGNYRQAGEYLTYIYDYYMKELGENDDKTNEALLDLALNYHQQKKYVDADVLLRSVFTPIRKKLENKDENFRPPSYYPHLVTGYAVNLIALEKYDAGIKIFKQTLDKLPADGCDDGTISCTCNLAIGLMNSGKLEEADEIFRSLLKKLRALHGNNHPSTLNCLNSIGTLYLKFKRYADAEAIFSECFELQKKVLGINHPLTLSTLNNLFHVLINQRKYDEAATACAQCLEKRKLVLGYDNRDTLFSMNNWGVICIARNNFEEAEKVFTDCVRRMRVVLGKEDDNTINATIRLIRLYERSGRVGEALKLRKTIPASKLKNI